MKTCNSCGSQLEDAARFCFNCGSSDFTPQIQQTQQPVTPPPVYNPELFKSAQANSEGSFAGVPLSTEPEAGYDPNDKSNGNIPMGILGAFLFSILGAAIYCIMYQLGVIAGIAGFMTFLLASYGYRTFAKTKSKISMVSTVTSIVLSLIMLFMAEYLSLSIDVFSVAKDEGYTFFESMIIVPAILEDDSEIAAAVVGDLVFAYLCSIVAIIIEVVKIAKARKGK